MKYNTLFNQFSTFTIYICRTLQSIFPTGATFSYLCNIFSIILFTLLYNIII